MSSVTERVQEVRQPWGGYIKLSQFSKIQLEDGHQLFPEENVHGSIIGMTVDYMTRYMTGSDLKDVFSVSCCGAMIAEKLGKKNALKEAFGYFQKIEGLDKRSIENACKLVTFEVWFKAPAAAASAKTAKDTVPSTETIENIKTMINRSLTFCNQYGPIIKNGFTFEPHGYTKVIDSGDGDYLTKDTLWDFKVNKTKITSKHTLQLLIYWIMGQHSGNPIFREITKIGFYNPRFNQVYQLAISDIPSEIINIVEKDIIGY